jgi:hypothetical protein
MIIVFSELVLVVGGVYAATIGNWVAVIIALFGMACLLAGTDWRDT